MSVFLLSIGDEVLDGRTLNTNASYFGEQLRLNGISVSEIRCVSDRINDIVSALKASSQYSLTVVTGGLGPTNDDRTLEAAAIFFHRKLITPKESLTHSPLNKKRLKLAKILKGAKIIPNIIGTAPGLYLKHKSSHIFFLPGVPTECKPMFQSAIIPLAKKLFATRTLVKRAFWRCFGKGESQIYHSIAPIVKKLEKLYPDTFIFGVHITFPYIDLTLEVWSEKGKKKPNSKEIQSAMENVQKKIKDVCFTHDRENLSQVVFRLLKEKKQTLATAESCTGGLLGKVLTDIPGSSSIYLGGIISYANTAKTHLLGVQKSTLAQFGAVSEETVREMANTARLKFHSTYSLALSGISGPGGGTKKKPVGTICVALSSANGTKSFRQIVLGSTGSRDQNRIIASELALDTLRMELIRNNTSH